MTRHHATLLVLSTLVYSARFAGAADAKTAQCLRANEASIDLDNQHKLRAERTQLIACAAASCPTDIRNECLRRLDEIASQVPTIIFETKDAAGNGLRAIKVTMDGEVLATSLDGTALPVDPGEHDFTFESPGAPSVKKSFVIRQAQKDRHEPIVIGPVPVASPPSIPTSSAASTVGSNQDVGAPVIAEAPPPGTGMGAQKVAALVAGGIGVVGVGIGTAFGVQAQSLRDEARVVCPELCSDVNGQQAWADAKHAGNVSTAFFIAGGVGLATGVVLWLTAPSQPKGIATAQLRASIAAMELRVRW